MAPCCRPWTFFAESASIGGTRSKKSSPLAHRRFHARHIQAERAPRHRQDPPRSRLLQRAERQDPRDRGLPRRLHDGIRHVAVPARAARRRACYEHGDAPDRPLYRKCGVRARHRRRRQRLWQCHRGHPHRAGVHSDGGGRHPPRGPGHSQAMRSRGGASRDPDRGGGGQVSRGRHRPPRSRSGVRAHRPHRRAGRPRGQARRGHPPGQCLSGSGGRSRLRRRAHERGRGPAHLQGSPRPRLLQPDGHLPALQPRGDERDGHRGDHSPRRDLPRHHPGRLRPGARPVPARPRGRSRLQRTLQVAPAGEHPHLRRLRPGAGVGRGVSARGGDGEVHGLRGPPAREVLTRRSVPAMMPTIRRLAWLLPVALLVLPAAGWGEDAPRRRGEIRVATYGDPGTLDPHITTDVPALRIRNQICETLITWDAQTKESPMLADSWANSADGTVWTFKLRRGVKFHGGQPLRAADVKYSFERILKVSPRKTDYSMIKEIRTPDDSTVQFVLSARSNAFFSALAMYWAQVVEASGTEKQVKETGGVATPNCTGPFKVAEYRRGQSLKIVRHDAYVPRPEKPSGTAGARVAYADGIIFTFIPDANVRLLSLQQGEVHYIERVLPEQVEQLRKLPGIEVVAIAGTQWSAIYFN